jgi:hypothetical protein
MIHIVAPTSKSFISPCPFRPPHQNRRHLPRPTLMTPETSLRKTSSDDCETSTTESDHVDTTSDLRSSRWTKQDYTILETPSRAARRLRVITIGAGASAFNFAHGVSTSDLDTDLACYEKNPEIGGTWYENKYPEYACDIPSVNYQLSWAPAVCSAYFSTVPRSWHISIRWQKARTGG